MTVLVANPESTKMTSRFQCSEIIVQWKGQTTNRECWDRGITIAGPQPAPHQLTEGGKVLRARDK